MSMVNKTTEDTFDNDVLKATKPVLVDFWAEWCGPCRTLGPILDDLALELGDKVSIVKVNADDNPNLSQTYGIRGIPTMLFFKDGVISKTLVGVKSKDEIKSTLEELV